MPSNQGGNDTSPEQQRQQRLEGARLKTAYESRFPHQGLYHFAELVGGTRQGIRQQVNGDSWMKNETLEYYGRNLGYDPKAFAAWIGEGVVTPEFEAFEANVRATCPLLFIPDDPPGRGASRSAVPRSQPQLKVASGR